MTETHKKIRVRFAPSPTGFLHFGGARTALFNWLFAKNHKGDFILRIEDTDKKRSLPEYEKDLIDGLKWLGLEWDEKPYKQSERTKIYEKYLKKLLDEDKAYYCFCSKEELEKDRQAMMAQGLAPKYSGRCRHLLKEKVVQKLKNKEQSVIRFKIPLTEVEFHDLIRGKIVFNSELIGDTVIAKSINSPVFIFAGVVDDYEMKITHIIRGEDHISNTPKQILIQMALGFETPKYAHLPLILAPDKRKLSKRYTETSLNDFRKNGYLPEALINFMALLGWHPKEDREVLTIEELIKEFDIRRVQKGGAIFNLEKLEWLNAQHIKNLKTEILAKEIKKFIPESWPEKEEIFIKAVETEKNRMKRLTDFRELADFFFDFPDYETEILFWRDLDKEKTKSNLKIIYDELEKIFKVDFNKNKLENAIMPLTEVWGRGELLWPLRVSLSGKRASPGPFEIMDVLGKEETLKRINMAIEKLG